MNFATKRRNANLALHLTRPVKGSEIRDLLREFASLTGVARAAPMARLGRVLVIDYDPDAIVAETLVERARRHWGAVQRVGIRSAV